MTAPRGLMGVGMPAQLAKRLGIPSGNGDATLSGTGTTQATAAAIGQFQFYVRGVGTATSAVGYILPSNAEVGSEYKVMNTTATMVIWPPVGGQLLIPGGLTATGISLSVGKGGAFIAVSSSLFDTYLDLGLTSA